MDYMKEINHALKDGRRNGEHKEYIVEEWDDKDHSAIAYSVKFKEVLLLYFDQEHQLSGDELLDAAKKINLRLKAFVSPNQKVEPRTLWGGKTAAVTVYKFKIFEKPSIF